MTNGDVVNITLKIPHQREADEQVMVALVSSSTIWMAPVTRMQASIRWSLPAVGVAGVKIQPFW